MGIYPNEVLDWVFVWLDFCITTLILSHTFMWHGICHTHSPTLITFWLHLSTASHSHFLTTPQSCFLDHISITFLPASQPHFLATSQLHFWTTSQSCLSATLQPHFSVVFPPHFQLHFSYAFGCVQPHFDHILAAFFNCISATSLNHISAILFNCILTAVQPHFSTVIPTVILTTSWSQESMHLIVGYILKCYTCQSQKLVCDFCLSRLFHCWQTMARLPSIHPMLNLTLTTTIPEPHSSWPLPLIWSSQELPSLW